MKVSISKINEVLTCTLEGRLDTAASEDCLAEMQQLFENANQNILIDCATLDYISSSGLRILLSLRKKVSEQEGTLTISNLSTEIKNVFDLTGFTKIFNLK